MCSDLVLPLFLSFLSYLVSCSVPSFCMIVLFFVYVGLYFVLLSLFIGFFLSLLYFFLSFLLSFFRPSFIYLFPSFSHSGTFFISLFPFFFRLFVRLFVRSFVISLYFSFVFSFLLYFFIHVSFFVFLWFSPCLSLSFHAHTATHTHTPTPPHTHTHTVTMFLRFFELCSVLLHFQVNHLNPKAIIKSVARIPQGAMALTHFTMTRGWMLRLISQIQGEYRLGDSHKPKTFSGRAFWGQQCHSRCEYPAFGFFVGLLMLMFVADSFGLPGFDNATD